MPRFTYRALSADGSQVQGEIAAKSDAQALDLIARRGLTPVLLAEATATVPWWSREISLTGSATLPPADLERFFATLAAMLQARFPLPRALTFCRSQTKNAALRGTLAVAQNALEDGATLSQALREGGAAFPERFLALIDVGETSNRLDTVIARAAAILKAEATLRRELRSALVYPAILLLMSLVVLGIVIFYLAPTLLPVFSSAGAPAPGFLRALAGLGNLLATEWPLLLGGALCVLVLLYALRGAVGKVFARLVLAAPLTGTYLRRRETLKICQSLGLMLGSGASLPPALSAAREAVALDPYRALLQSAEAKVVAGGTLAAALGNGDLIDRTALGMIEAGEEADDLRAILDAAAVILAEETSRTLTQAIRTLTPVLTLTIAFGVGAIILTKISAIMDLNDIAF